MRAAVYWAPALNTALKAAGDSWLGRDPETGACMAQPDLPGMAELTCSARGYGFHATLRPPMRLATRYISFRQAVGNIAAETTAFRLPPLRVAAVDGFLALILRHPCPALHGLADACVLGTEPHRLPANAEELSRRRAAHLTAEQDEMLRRFGYPYVMRSWMFHMTLSRKLSEAEMDMMLPAAEAHFAGALGPASIAEICIFTQRLLDDGRQTSFLVAERLSFGS